MKLIFSLAIAIAEAACATGVRPAPPPASAFLPFGEWMVDTTPDKKFVRSLTGVPDRQTRFSPGAPEILPFVPAMVGAEPGSLTFAAPTLERIGTLERYRHQQVIDGRPVENGEVIVQTDTRGGSYDIVVNAVAAKTVPAAMLPPQTAATVVKEVFESDPAIRSYALLTPGGERSDLPALRFKPQTFVEVRGEPHLLAFERRLHIVFEVAARAMIRSGERDVVIADRIYSIDASEVHAGHSSIVRVRNLMHGNVTGTVRVFDPSPIDTVKLCTATKPIPCCAPAALNTQAYSSRPVNELVDPTNGKFALAGPYAAVLYDLPNGPLRSSTSDFSTDRGSVQFAAASAYYWVDQAARRAIGLGFTNLVRPKLAIDVYVGDSPSPQAYFHEAGGAFAAPRLTFWRTDPCSIFVAEDRDVVNHEYSHSLLQSATGTSFLLSPQKKDINEAEAMGEGLADYWALSASTKTGEDLNCYGEWSNSKPCFRTYPDLKHRTFNDDPVMIHTNGEIWSGTLKQILEKAFAMDTAAADSVILLGHIAGAPKGGAPTMLNIAEGILIEDLGAHTATLCEIFRHHDIGPPRCCREKACTANHLNLPP